MRLRLDHKDALRQFTILMFGPNHRVMVIEIQGATIGLSQPYVQPVHANVNSDIYSIVIYTNDGSRPVDAMGNTLHHIALPFPIYFDDKIEQVIDEMPPPKSDDRNITPGN